MDHQYAEQMDYVEKVLKEAGRDEGRKHPFRSRSRHTRRVLSWAERLIEGRNDIDENILFTAVIFHDIGYVSDTLDEHAKVSEKMFREYAGVNGYEDKFIEDVSKCIRLHSDKYRLANPDQLTMEQIILMEADLLDEEGALAICWDGMACGFEGKSSYEESLERTIKEFEPKKGYNPMVTEQAKCYWNEKMQFVSEYIEKLKFDLEI